MSPQPSSPTHPHGNGRGPAPQHDQAPALASADRDGLKQDGGADIRLLRPADGRFTPRDGGFLGYDMSDGTTHARIGAIRLFPIRYPAQYISIRDADDAEIGIIEQLADFPAEQRRLVATELDLRRYLPAVLEIPNLVMGDEELYWDVVTDHGPRLFTSKRRGAIRHLRDGRFVVTDSDGCRYLIPPLSQLPRRTRVILEGIV